MLTVLSVIAVLIVAVLILAATRPDTLTVERSTTINAPPEQIFPLLADFHRWSSWSPYEKKDPALKRTYGGADSGKGAVYEWAGNNVVGQGRMEITDVVPASKVTIKLDFVRPFEGHNVAEFRLVPQGANTVVTWGMNGPSSYIMKVMCLFMNMDKMIGTDFEAGLENLKAISEKEKP